MSTALKPLDFSQIPVQRGADEDYADLAKGASYLPSLCLFTFLSGPVKNQLAKPGHYGLVMSKDQVVDLGDSIDILVLARRAKAVDFSVKDDQIISYDRNSKDFKDIQERSEQAELKAKNKWGVSFLVLERGTGRLAEFFCNTASLRPEAGKLFDFMTLTADDIERKEAADIDVSKLQPHGPLPVTLKSRLKERGEQSWHVPIVLPCSTPITRGPDVEEIAAEIAKFITAKSTGETVDEPETRSKRKR